MLALANPVRVRGKTTQTLFGTLRTVILLLLLKQTVFLQHQLLSYSSPLNRKTGDYIQVSDHVITLPTSFNLSLERKAIMTGSSRYVLPVLLQKLILRAN